MSAVAANRWSPKAVAAVALLAAAGIAALALIPGNRHSTTFLGHYRYRFRLTPETAAAYELTATFRDEAHVSEVVFVHPKSISSVEVLKTPESDYALQRVVRLEVNPNSSYPPKAQEKLVEAFEFAAKQTLDARGVPYKLAALEGAPLPGFAIEIGGPKPITQVFMKGKRVYYLFTAAGDSQPLHEMISSLQDPDGAEPQWNKPETTNK
jgi:hypothetical protein